jgi:hypothetical protein
MYGLLHQRIKGASQKSYINKKRIIDKRRSRTVGVLHSFEGFGFYTGARGPIQIVII